MRMGILPLFTISKRPSAEACDERGGICKKEILSVIHSSLEAAEEISVSAV